MKKLFVASVALALTALAFAQVTNWNTNGVSPSALPVDYGAPPGQTAVQFFGPNTNAPTSPNMAFLGITTDINNIPFPSLTLQGDGAAILVDKSVNGTTGNFTEVSTLNGVYADSFRFHNVSGALKNAAGAVIMNGDGSINNALTISNAAGTVVFVSLATNNTPGISAANGSLVINTNGAMYVRSNGVWVQK